MKLNQKRIQWRVCIGKLEMPGSVTRILTQLPIPASFKKGDVYCIKSL
jgi:hypothetical protein